MLEPVMFTGFLLFWIQEFRRVSDKSGGPGSARGVSSPLITLLLLFCDDAVLDS